MLGIIGGTAILHTGISDLKKQVVHTPFGSSELMTSDNIALLQRHQFNRPPHRVNFRSHLSALAILGVDVIILLGSTGSLNTKFPPGTVVIPTDYFCAMHKVTIYNQSIHHITAQISIPLAQKLQALFPTAHYGGCYVQTQGPRFETKHEIQYFAQYGDIVGMTLAHEIMLASDLGIHCAALCFVDNYANGINDTAISYEDVLASAKKTQKRTDTMIRQLCNAFT
jgi:5'-methylthioadenosine phosphorylase